MKSSYVKTKLDNIINVTEVVTIHYYEFSNNFVFGGEKHNFWEIVYVDSGSVEVQTDDGRFVLRQGEIIFHKPNEFHSIRAYDSAPNIFVLSFVSRSAAMKQFFGMKTDLGNEMKPFITSILSEANSTYKIPKNDIELKCLVKKENALLGGEQLIKTYLEQFLILLLRKMTKEKAITVFPSQLSLQTQLVSDIKRYIMDRVYERISIDDVCTYFGYSKTYLSTIFKEQCSSSIIKFFNECKIEEAKRLIRSANMNFSEISDKLSFDNPQYFTRTFKRISGLTPTQFKNSLSISK